MRILLSLLLGHAKLLGALLGLVTQTQSDRHVITVAGFDCASDDSLSLLRFVKRPLILLVDRLSLLRERVALDGAQTCLHRGVLLTQVLELTLRALLSLLLKLAPLSALIADLLVLVDYLVFAVVFRDASALVLVIVVLVVLVVFRFGIRLRGLFCLLLIRFDDHQFFVVFTFYFSHDRLLSSALWITRMPSSRAGRP